jgi:hypothetical protein
MAGIRRLDVMTAAALFVAVASAFFGAQPASANPAFAQAAQQPNCSTCHQPGLEKSAPNAGFTPTGQAIYNAFVTAGTSCSYNIANAVSSQLSVNGAPVMPCTGGAAPASQPNQMQSPYPSPQPAPYPQQPATPTYPQSAPYPQPYQQPAPYPQQPVGPAYPNQQPAYPAGPQPYQPQPQAYMGPPPWTQPKGRMTQFQQFCLLTGKAYFTLRYNGSETNALHFTLSGSNKVSIEAPSGSKWNSNCDDYPGNGSIWFTTP